MGDDATRDGESRTPGLSRRDALLVGGGLAVGAAGAVLAPRVARGGGRSPTDGATASAGDDGAVVPAGGEHQAGIARPPTPQAHALVAVLSLADRDDPGFVAELRRRLAAVSHSILDFAGRTDATAVAPDGAPDLTATIGLGPDVVAAIDPTLPGADALPAFAGDDGMADARNGGDVYVGLHAGNPAVLAPALADVVAGFEAASVRWQQFGFRAPGTGTVARNPLGYLDGIIVPRGERELARNVWIADGRASGGTICVIRQLRLDVARFRAEPLARQDDVIGRHKGDGSPLSGGGPLDEVDLVAKTETGEFVTPLRSHARAAHPSFTGSDLMLRRGYAYANGPVTTTDGATVDDQGLLFICFQRDLADFVRTQRRLDETDDLMAFATPVSSGSFLILPGFTRESPLGTPLFA